ncbi:hypothetical protein [Endozoicomonas sp. 4G]|uniref:hypothetical protein n=1 Tax=Endozoicomonas sp. 4G TaxID=2872754 RepID=UPI002078F92D|nr:hypothetical protein [Endozoicomonas sp. 4G]
MSELHIANPKRIVSFIRRMQFVAVATVILVYFSRDFFITALMSNLPLNGTILSVFIIGTVLCFLYVFQLKDDVLVVAKLDEILFENKDGLDDQNVQGKPKPLKMHLMGPTVTLLKNNIASLGVIRLSAPATRALIDSLQDSMSEKSAFIRYFTDLLVFIGLLGTFLGLTITIGSIGGILSDLAAGLDGGDIMETLVKLVRGLEGPLGGMSTAFGSSLMGLSTSLVLGIFLLSLDKAGYYFTSAMENWLAEHTVERHSNGRAATTTAAPAIENGQLEQITSQLGIIADTLKKISIQSTDDRQWQTLIALLNSNHRELKNETSGLSESLLRAEQHLETSAGLQSNQLALAQLQLQESEKLRQLFTTQTDASVEALGAVQESKHRLVQIVNTLLDEQKALGRSHVQTTEQITGLQTSISQKTDDSVSEIKVVSQQLQALSEKVQEDNQASQIRQSRMEKLFMSMSRAIKDVRARIKGN